MTASTDRRTGTRPIHVDHIDGQHHIVHGVYGVVAISGSHYSHLTLTWTAARPYLVDIAITSPANGDTAHWYIHRDLLRTGGRNGNVRVDHAGQVTFLVISGERRQPWISLNRDWIGDLVSHADAICPPPRDT